MSVSLITVAALCIFVAAALHGVSGTGFALAAMPALLLLFGAHSGIRLGLALGLVVSLLVLAKYWRSVDLRRAALLTVPAFAAIPIGAVVARVVPGSVLLVVAGASVLLLVAVASLVSAPPTDRRTSGWIASGIVTGVIAGFVHVLSALSAPVLVAYALRTRWSLTPFIATAQLVFILLNVASLATWGIDGETIAALAWLVPALAVGLLLGVVLRMRISQRATVLAITAVALAGGAVAVVRGVLQLAMGPEVG